MRHENSVFHSLQKHIPWAEFERLVDKHGADYRVRRLDSKSHFLAMLFGQLSGAEGLRDIEAGLASQSAPALSPRRGLCGALDALRCQCPPPRRALCRSVRPHGGDGRPQHAPAACRCNPHPRCHQSAVVVALCELARTQQGKRAIKLHIVYDPAADIPLQAGLTPQAVNDITPAKAMPIEPGMTYVFDLAYYDYGWWAGLDGKGCRFVSRLKTNTRLAVTAELAVPEEDDDILSDRIGLLPQRMARSRRNPFADPVREIAVRISTGKTIRLVTNDLDAPAREIADLYKERWQIELFFKWIKQNLKIRHFLGTSENAVRIQIFVALIAFILLRLAQATQSAISRPLTFVRLIRLNLMHRRPITALAAPPPPQYDNHR